MSHFLTPIRLALIVALVLVLGAGFIFVPAETILPVHWGPSGEADGFLPRDAALLAPALLVVAVWGLFSLVAKTTAPGKLAGSRYGLSAALTGFTALGLVIEAVLVLIGVGVAVSMVQVLSLALGTLLIVLGNAMPKSQPNWVFGLRLPTTLRSAENWQATHRFTGILSMASGLVLIVAALVVPLSGLVWWLIGCALGPVIIGSIYSLSIASK